MEIYKLQLVYLLVSLLLQNSAAYHTPYHKIKTCGSRLFSIGTDILIRPDDENSPEFKAYLRQLMILQANRARTGYAEASSSSSDAYIAKLNRIKIERQKMKELGLPEDAVDTSYKEEDFLNAK